MANYFICLLLQRLVLPLILVACFVFRPVGLSFPYLLLFFYLPLVPVATPNSMKGHTGNFLKLVIAVSILLSIIQIIFQIVVIAIGTEFLEKCELLEMIFRHVGLVKFNNLSALTITWWLLPEVVMLITSIILFIALRKIALGRVRDLEGNDSENLLENHLEESQQWTQQKFKLLSGIGVFLSLFSLLLAASLRPSMPSAVYFIVYLGAGTWWACYRELSRAFAIVCRIIMVFAAAHITTYLTYQTPWPQEFIPVNSTIQRYLGFAQIFRSTCDNNTDIRDVSINETLKIDSYLNPFSILLCYYILAISSSLLLQPKANFNRAQHESSTVPNERTPLMRKSTKRLRDIKNEHGTTVIVEEEPEIPLENIESPKSKKRKPKSTDNSGFFDQLFIIVENLAGIIYKNSYIFTNIIMMTWSIMYHSWLTFVLLIWANILWMIPNQRKAMLRSSPFIVFYAILLLIAQFIYGMDLTEDELPTKVDTAGIKLEQIGFIRYEEFPVKHILLKSLFTVMFWITLRQLIQESRLQKQKSTLADMVAPLQVTVGAATADLAPSRDNKISSEFMKKAGTALNQALVKTWIWIVMIALFVSGMAGTQMTGFRIIYMTLFLLFIIIFQISWRVWRRFMYGFWIFLIAYAMAILVLVYTYQFDRFPQYWYNYLGIPPKLQKDIGLDVYATKELFLHLVNPTAVVIMTVIQLHYFHSKYVKMLDIPVRQNSDNSQHTNSSTNYGNMGSEPEDDNTISEDRTQLQEQKSKPENKSKWSLNHLKSMTKSDWLKLFDVAWRYTSNALEYVWLFFELHWIKFIMLYAFLLSIYNVCLLHITLVILTVIAITSRSSLQILVSRVISVFVAILFIVKMIYQIDFIEHNNYDVVCNNETNPIGINNADWFGLTKAQDKGLFDLLEGYFVYLVIVTIHAVVVFRQLHKRSMEGKPTRKPQIMFPKITRNRAEKNLPNMIMYLLNYGFFRFGIEVCLISIVALIGARLDMMACFYAIWLAGLFALNRQKIIMIWKLFMIFISTALIIQYVVIIGIPPGSCFEYPWNTTLLKDLQKWAMLPDANLHKQVRKLIFDFLVLFFVSRQNLVFRIEKRYNDQNSEFPGGSNKSIIEDIDKRGFSLIENPTPDFTSNIRNWLDILKRGILLGFFWFTLAIVFLTGTNRVNLFSIGYLVGSFIFLWQGSDFYLRPIRNIIQWWTALLGYNVFVIFFKCFLQIAGCLFFEVIANGNCWLIQLLGITCIEKFDKKFSNASCSVSDKNVGLFWDGICFGFLLLQLRIFKSYYFVHIVNDTKASNILASRGAQLIEAFRTKQVKIQTEHEMEILQKIKQKMDRIKATQKKLLEPMAEPKTHAQAIRSGDYYMFEELDNKLDLDILNPKEDPEAEEEEAAAIKDKLTVTQGGRRSVSRIADDEEIVQPDGQQPSTSKGGGSDESKQDQTQAADVEIPKDEEEKRSRLQGLLFIWSFIESILISLTVRLNRVSRNYRYVMKVLQQEKKTLKSSEGFGIGIKISSALFFGQPSHSDNQPTEDGGDVAVGTTSTISSGSVSLEIGDSPRKSWGSSTNLPTREATPGDQLEQGLTKHSSPPRGSSQDQKDSKPSDEEIEDFSTKEHSAVVDLLQALWFAILSHTDFVCYLMVFLNQIKSASILSLPLPLMVFFWGTLTIPRPSKTFWITLIAYTQTVVLLKCISQFDMLWWNQKEITPNQPLSPARIFGVEKKEGYATWDLALLLVVFFHRFMLKSMGLWKSEITEDIIPDGTYKIQSEKDKNKPEALMITDGEKQLIVTKVDGENQGQTPNSDEIQVTNTAEETEDYFPGIIKLSTQKYTSSIKQFFTQILGPASRVTRDVYAYMFLCDFINFLVLLFGFTSFGSTQGDGGVTAYLEENKVPVTFLVMLLLQFVLIIIDRALYLRKYMLGKVIFQYALIVVIHIWMFFILPGVTERNFNAKLPPVIWYLIKCFYLLLSAFQIRCGYPTRILGNFLTKGFSIVNVMLHRVFMAIPFLFELRTLMDWIWTDTTMTLFDWLKMEDIFVNIYQQKCSRQMEEDFPAPRGIKKPYLVKYLMGGGMLIALIALIWFPLALFALGNTVGEPNPPYDVTVSLRIGPYEPVYSMSAQDSNIITFNELAYYSLNKKYAKDRTALTFLSSYEATDITAIMLASNSTAIWNISPPDKMRLIEDIKSNNTLTCRFKYTVSRKTYSKENPGEISSEKIYELEANNPYRAALAEMLENQTLNQFVLPALFPKFLKVKNAGTLKPAPQLLGDGLSEIDDTIYRNLSLTLFHSSNDPVMSQMWWEVKEVCNDTLYTDTLKDIPYADCNKKIVMYLFNDKLFPSTLSILTAGGIIGMYTTFVILFSRVIRGIFSGMSSKIMFDDLPYVDRVLQLCLDIYLVRESLEFALEEDLFAKLIFLYRSPETMIKWTRPKDERLDDDDEEDDDDDVDNDARPIRVVNDDDDYTDNRSILRKRKPSPDSNQ